MNYPEEKLSKWVRLGAIAASKARRTKHEEHVHLFNEHILNLRCVEPVKRWVAGKFDWAVHRFPIKGGVSRAGIIGREMADSLYQAANRKGFLRRFIERIDDKHSPIVRVPNFSSVNSFKLKPTIVG